MFLNPLSASIPTNSLIFPDIAADQFAKIELCPPIGCGLTAGNRVQVVIKKTTCKMSKLSYHVGVVRLPAVILSGAGTKQPKTLSLREMTLIMQAPWNKFRELA